MENSFLRQTRIWPPIVYHSARYVHRGSYTCYMNSHVLLNLLNELRKTIKCETCQAFYHLFGTRLINSIKQDSTNVILYLSRDIEMLKNSIFDVKTSILVLPSLTQR